jgi:hypothetical protein
MNIMNVGVYKEKSLFSGYNAMVGKDDDFCEQHFKKQGIVYFQNVIKTKRSASYLLSLLSRF